MLVFIASAAAVAILLARKPTIADGRVMEAEFLGLLRPQGVTGVVCDREIPIGRQGAVFACTATLKNGATQLLDCAMNREGKLTANPAAAPSRSPAPAADPGHDGIPTADDPWSNRP